MEIYDLEQLHRTAENQMSVNVARLSTLYQVPLVFLGKDVECYLLGFLCGVLGVVPFLF